MELLGDRLLEPDGLNAALAPALPPGAVVSGVEVVPLGEQQGYASRVERVRVSYEPPGAGPETLIVKLARPDTAKESGESQPFARAQVVGTLVHPEDAVRRPRCYFAETTADGNGGALVLEDLGAWRPGDEYDGLDDDALAAALTAIARLHAWGWETERPLLAELPSGDYPVDRALVRYWPQIRPYVVTGLGDPVATLGDRFVAGFPALTEALLSRPLTLVHGDLHSDNLRFDPAARGAEAVAVLDWGSAFVGVGAYDPARLAGTSAARPATLARLEDACSTWHAALLAAGVAGYSGADAWRDFEAGIALAFPSALSGLREDPDPVRAETARRRGRRVLAALVATDAWGAASELAIEP